MIDSESFLSWFNLQNGAKRLRIFNSESRHFELVLDSDSLEFEKLMLSLYLLEKYKAKEKELHFETENINKMEQIAEEVESLFNFLTSRRLSIKFVSQKKNSQGKKVQVRLQDLGEPIAIAGPCLYSGGLDSAAGAIALTKMNKNPILCHTATSNIIMGKVVKLHTMAPFSTLPLIITDMRTEAGDFMSGKARGLLFISNAALLAYSLGYDEMFMPENGPLMINPKLSSLADPTKNAHPYLLTTIEKIFSSITSSKMKINAIFKNSTKAEVIASSAVKGILNDTWSCFRVQCKSHMCGLCYACFVRRLSVLAVGYQEPDNTYDYNPFTIDRSKLGGVDVQDLDILHDSILFFKRLYSKEYTPEIEPRIPNDFFENPSDLLSRYSLDMFLGIKKLLEISTEIGSLGRFASDIMKDIPEDQLSHRAEQLKAIAETNSKFD